MQKDVLNYSVILFFAFIMLSVGFCQLTSRNYDASNAQVVHHLKDNSFIAYAEINQILTGDKVEDFLIVDLRQADVFEKGHLPGAVNIPMNELLNRQHRSKLNAARQILLYANEQHLALAAQVLLTSQGYDQAKVIPGSYESIRQFALDDFQPAKAFYNDDKARFDYPRFMSVKAVQPAQQSPARPEVPQVEDSTPVAGGC